MYLPFSRNILIILDPPLFFFLSSSYTGMGCFCWNILLSVCWKAPRYYWFSALSLLLISNCQVEITDQTICNTHFRKPTSNLTEILHPHQGTGTEGLNPIEGWTTQHGLVAFWFQSQLGKEKRKHGEGKQSSPFNACWHGLDGLKDPANHRVVSSSSVSFDMVSIAQYPL